MRRDKAKVWNKSIDVTVETDKSGKDSALRNRPGGTGKDRHAIDRDSEEVRDGKATTNETNNTDRVYKLEIGSGEKKPRDCESAFNTDFS